MFLQTQQHINPLQVHQHYCAERTPGGPERDLLLTCYWTSRPGLTCSPALVNLTLFCLFCGHKTACCFLLPASENKWSWFYNHAISGSWLTTEPLGSQFLIMNYSFDIHHFFLFYELFNQYLHFKLFRFQWRREVALYQPKNMQKHFFL